MATLLGAVLETFAGPLIILVWIARMVLFGGGVLFLLAAPFAHKSMGIALLYFVHAVAMTLVLRFLRRLRTRVIKG
jgi:hypothetical protein